MRKPQPSTIFLILWGLFLAVSVALYLSYLQPSRLGKTVADHLRQALGAECNIRQVDLSFFPYPAVIINDLYVEIKKPAKAQGESSPAIQGQPPLTLRLHVESCRAELSWLSLIKLDPVLRAAKLQSPSLDIEMPLSGRTFDEADFANGSATAQKTADLIWEKLKQKQNIPSFLKAFLVQIQNGRLRLYDKSPLVDGQPQKARLSLIATGISGTARLPGLFRGHINLAVQQCEILAAPLPTIQVSNIHLDSSSLHTARHGEWEGKLALRADIQMNALDELLGRSISAPYRYFPMPKPAKLDITTDFGLYPEQKKLFLDGLVEFSALLPMNGYNTPIVLSAPFLLEDPDTIELERMHLVMDTDSAFISGVLTGLPKGTPVLTGTAKLEHFSLIRWFEFGRLMPAGLQRALNDIAGELDFRLDKHGVVAPRLVAHTAGMTLNGQGSCADFLQPDVRIAGTIDKADLNILFPELNAKAVSKPDLPPPALLIPLSDTPALVGYDIQIMADKARIWNLNVENVQCNVLPAELPIRPEGYPSLTPLDYALLPPKQLGARPKKGTILRITVGKAYGGKGEAYVHLNEITRILAHARNVALEAPIHAVAGFSAFGGTLNGGADIQLSGHTALQMLNSLQGTVDASVSNGYMASRVGENLAFNKLSLNAKAKANAVAGTSVPPRMSYTGNWKVSLDTANWTLSTNTPATLSFSMSNGLPASMTPQALPLLLRLDKEGVGLGLWHEDMVLNLKGQAAFDIDKGVATLDAISGGMPGLLLGGSLRAQDIQEKPVITGKISAKTAILREMSAKFGLPLPSLADPTAMRDLTLEGSLYMDAREMKLTRLHSRLDDSTVTGSLGVSFARHPFWTADLQVDTIDIDRYFPKKNPAQPPVPMPVDFMRIFDLDARVSFAKVLAFQTPLERAKLPLTLRGGVLSTDVCTAFFPGGGSASATFAAKAEGKGGQKNASVSSRLQLRLREVDMLSVSKARKQETLLAGTGSCQADLQATMRTWNDLPSHLDGNWSLDIRDGYIGSASPSKEIPQHSQQLGSPLSQEKHSGPDTPVQAGTNSGRTPFSTLSASGSILNGIIRSTNFNLSGGAIAIKGGGNIDLNTLIIDAKAAVTLLGVPEVPVEISGNLTDPKTSYKVMQALASTLGNLGGTVLDIVGGILTAPFRLLGVK